MLLSAVITTRNESANIANCVHTFDGFRDRVEVIVVDNASDDDTKAIAESLGAKVFLPRETVEEMLAIASSPDSLDAYWIPEVRTGSGIRVKARNFERSFYDGTCIDALRLFSRRVLEKTGGYDENLIAGPEDWELDIRVLETGAKCAVMSHNLIHNEKKLTFRRMLEKKAYYTKSFAAYQEKWKGHPAVRKQFSPWYRFVGVFIENGKWKRLLRHPILAAAMYIERIAVGVVYLVNR